MRAYLKGVVVALSLLCAGVLVSPSAQVQIQRGFNYAEFILFGDGSVSAPAIAPQSNPDTGIRFPNGAAIYFTVNATDYLGVFEDEIQIKGSALIGASSGNIGAASDTKIQRDAAGIWLITNSARYSGVAFASLGTPTNGTVTYCTDCTPNVSPCTGAGTGAIAKRLNAAWDCR